MKTKTTLCAILFALVAIVYHLALTSPAQADGPTYTWQPSAAYLAARDRYLDFKAGQHDQYSATIGRSWSRAVPSPQERYSAWKDQLSVDADGSRYAPVAHTPR